MASAKRIAKELSDLTKEPIEGVEIETQEENIYKWIAKMKGPANTPYAAGTFNLLVDFPIEYPFKGPKIRFQTPIYHPNVDAEGNMCVGLLKSEAWKPSTKTATVLLAMRQLLQEPALDDALVASIAEIYQQDKAKFDQLATEHTKKVSGLPCTASFDVVPNLYEHLISSFTARHKIKVVPL